MKKHHHQDNQLIMDDPVLHIGPQLKRTMRSLYSIPDDALRVPQGMHVLNKSKDSFMALYKQLWDYHYEFANEFSYLQEKVHNCIEYYKANNDNDNCNENFRRELIDLMVKMLKDDLLEHMDTLTYRVVELILDYIDCLKELQDELQRPYYRRKLLVDKTLIVAGYFGIIAGVVLFVMPSLVAAVVVVGFISSDTLAIGVLISGIVIWFIGAACLELHAMNFDGIIALKGFEKYRTWDNANNYYCGREKVHTTITRSGTGVEVKKKKIDEEDEEVTLIKNLSTLFSDLDIDMTTITTINSSNSSSDSNSNLYPNVILRDYQIEGLLSRTTALLDAFRDLHRSLQHCEDSKIRKNTLCVGTVFMGAINVGLTAAAMMVCCKGFKYAINIVMSSIYSFIHTNLFELKCSVV